MDIKQDKVKPIGAMDFLKNIIPSMIGHRLYFIIICLCLCVQTLYGVVYPVIYKPIIDNLTNPNGFSTIMYMLIFLGILYILYTISKIASLYFSSKLGVRLTNQLRDRIFKKINLLDEKRIRKYSSQDIAQFFSADLALVELSIIEAIPPLIQNTIEAVFEVVILFYFSWQLALLYLFILPFHMVISYYYGGIASTGAYMAKTYDAKLSLLAFETVELHRSAKLFQFINYLNSKFQRLTESNYGLCIKQYIFSGLVPLLSNSVSQFGLILILSVGAIITAKGWISAGTLIAFIMLCRALASAISVIFEKWSLLIKATGGYRRIHEFLQEEVLAQPSQDMVAIPEVFTFNLVDLNFAYEQHNPILKNINSTLPTTGFIALVGNSGGGKSTLMYLLMGLDKSYKGEILINDYDLKTIDSDHYFNRIAYVQQFTKLLSGSIKENLLLGNLQATDDEVKHVLQQVDLDTTVQSLNNQYETLIGANGHQFSGGQMQRIGIARALLKKSHLIFLDEPTSALDPVTANSILSTIKDSFKSHLVFHVTHQLSEIEQYDLILVLKDGELVEQGDHTALMAKEGTYAQMYKDQKKAYITEQGKGVISVELLKELPLFNDVDEDFLHQLLPYFMLEEFEHNSTIIKQGEMSDKFYIIARGSVCVYKEKEGHSKLVATIENGTNNYFGEIALLLDIPRTTTVISNNFCSLLVLQREVFKQIIDKYPAIKKKMEHVAKQRIDEL